MKYLKVVAAAIFNDRGELFLALRPKDKHQGGLWEFPGGKIDAGESAREALARELREEIGIEVRRARPLITVRHRYPDLAVELDVWRVDRFSGAAHGREGQQTAWVPLARLSEYCFPEANLPIVRAVTLPEAYLVTPEPGLDQNSGDGVEIFLERLQRSIERGVRLVQLRAKTLSEAQYTALAERVLQLCRGHGARLILNGDPALLERVDADGIHLTAARLAGLERRPIADDKLLAASCHNEAELAKAQALVVDFAVLAPVAATATHPDAEPLGWARARALVDDVNLPVYFLGGMKETDMERVFECGGQGIAAIRALWGKS